MKTLGKKWTSTKPVNWRRARREENYSDAATRKLDALKSKTSQLVARSWLSEIRIQDQPKQIKMLVLKEIKCNCQQLQKSQTIFWTC